MDRLTVRDVDVRGKRVLVRVDFNVPIDEATGNISDDSRIRASLETINYLRENGASVILASHMGRPDGRVVESMRLGIAAKRLSELLGANVTATRDCIGPEAVNAEKGMKPGDVLVLENLRFHPEEEANDTQFSRHLADLADIYVDDAFGTAHRAHASIVGVTAYLPAVAGMLMEKELTYLGIVIQHPERPFGGLFGGAKVSDKLAMLENIIPRVDMALIGGSMAATFLKAESYEVGASLFEPDQVKTAERIIAETTGKGAKFLIPDDVVVARELSPSAEASVVGVGSIPSDQMILDIGPETAKKYCAELKACRTVFWNGPLGVNEIPQFAGGTQTLARFLSGLDATVVIGGGSTSDVVTNLGLADKMTFVSTGGGASLSYLSGKKLPGVEALLRRDSGAAKK